MKIKYALVKVLMLVDVRNAMVAMGTSGTKDVLAHLPGRRFTSEGRSVSTYIQRCQEGR
jgi:hypothetical protein